MPPEAESQKTSAPEGGILQNSNIRTWGLGISGLGFWRILGKSGISMEVEIFWQIAGNYQKLDFGQFRMVPKKGTEDWFQILFRDGP